MARLVVRSHFGSNRDISFDRASVARSSIRESAMALLQKVANVMKKLAPKSAKKVSVMKKLAAKSAMEVSVMRNIAPKSRANIVR